jgi:histidine ammonia-lyase
LGIALARLNELLAGSPIHAPGRARSLQDPLSFRNLPQLLGAAIDVLAHVDGVLRIELNASQGNPIVLLEEGRLTPTANFEILPLAAALDYLRILLASLVSSSTERAVKLLERPWSGLPTGLAASGDPADPGLSYLGIAAQSLAGEARLLATPVSFELVSTAHAEGIEDRTSLAPLAARRLAEMVELVERVVAVELVVAVEASERRALAERGAGTGRAAELVRRHVGGLADTGAMPDLEPLVAAVRRGDFAFETG